MATLFCFPEVSSIHPGCKRCLPKLHPSFEGGQDEPPLAINAHHIADKQLVPIVERSRLHVVLIGLDNVHGVQAVQTRHLITCVTLFCAIASVVLSIFCDSNLSLSSWNISLGALKSNTRTVASSPNSSSEIAGRAPVVDIVDGLFKENSRMSKDAPLPCQSNNDCVIS